MTALLLSLGASLAWGVSDFGAGAAARRHSLVTVLLFTRLGAVLATGAMTLALGAPGPGPGLPFALIGIAVAGTGTIALVSALAIGPMGITAPIAATGATIPAVAGLASGRAPGALVLVGLAAAATGAVLASRAPGRDGERARRAGVASAVAAAVLVGSGMVLMHEAATRSAITAVLVERGGEGLLVLTAVVAGLRRRALVAPARRDAVALCAFGAVDACAVVAYAAASTMGSLTVAAIMSSLYPVVTVVLARLLHHERLASGQLRGAVLILVGVALVAGGGS